MYSPAAKALCANSSSCQGFTFKAWERVPNASTSIKAAFKTIGRVVPEGDPEGLQPSPIAEPGEKGNRKPDGQPGIPSYGSQVGVLLHFGPISFTQSMLAVAFIIITNSV